MAHPLPSTIASRPPPEAAGVNRQLRRWLVGELRQLRPVIAQSADRCQADRYRKHFTAFAHACLLLFHGLSGGASLRQSYATFGLCDGLVALSGLGVRSRSGDDDTDAADERLGVSFSQVAASNTSRPAVFLSGLVPALLRHLRQLGANADLPYPLDLCLLDSTFLRLSVGLASWLPAAIPHEKHGVSVHVQYRPALDLPDHLLILPTPTNDCLGLDAAVLDDPGRLADLAGQTLAMDLGYYSHARLERLRAAGVHWVIPLNAQATVAPEAQQPVQPSFPGWQPARITVLRDTRVTIGSGNNRAGAVLAGLRVVTAEVLPQPAADRRGAPPQRYTLLTDRWDLPAAAVVQLYLWRWQIELFFKWLKSHLKLGRFLGYSANAVHLSVWLALVLHLLVTLAARVLGLRRRTPSILARLRFLLPLITATDLLDPQSLPDQRSFFDALSAAAPPPPT